MTTSSVWRWTRTVTPARTAITSATTRLRRRIGLGDAGLRRRVGLGVTEDMSALRRWVSTVTPARTAITSPTTRLRCTIGLGVIGAPAAQACNSAIHAEGRQYECDGTADKPADGRSDQP